MNNDLSHSNASGIIPAFLLVGVVYAGWWFQFFGIPFFVNLVLFAVILLMPVIKRPSISRGEANALIYFCIIFVLLLCSSFLLAHPEQSLSRLIPTFIFSCVGYLGVNRLANFILNKRTNFFILVNLGLSGLFVIFIFSFFILPGFSSGGFGGMRLSGGVNPNAAGGLALYGVIWASIVPHLSDQRSKTNGILMLLALLCVLLSFSRAAMLATVGYFLFLTFLALDRRLLSQIALIICMAIGVGAFFLHNLDQEWVGRYFIYIETRLIFDGTDDNVSSRAATWSILHQAFLASPIFGQFGWYGASHVLSELSDGFVATSPHNLHLRLLSEVGIFGYVLLLSLPIVAVFKAFLISNKRRRDLRGADKGTVILCRKIVAALLVIFFISEVFEDRFLTSYLNLTTLFVFFLIALVFSYPHHYVRTHKN